LPPHATVTSAEPSEQKRKRARCMHTMIRQLC
jgi:hypothetical protein